MAAAVGKDRVFGTVNGSASYALVSFSRRTGELDRGWRAHLSSVTGFYGAVSATAVAVADGRVYVTGDFDRVAGVRRNGFAALDQTSPRVLPSWQPTAGTVYGSLLAPSRDRLLLGISLSRQLRFNFTGLTTYRSVRTLRLELALSGAGTVRVGLGRRCNYERWTETARCSGPVFRWLDRVSFPRAVRRRYDHALRVRPGHYFVRFVPRANGGQPQAPYDFPVTVR